MVLKDMCKDINLFLFSHMRNGDVVRDVECCQSGVERKCMSLCIPSKPCLSNYLDVHVQIYALSMHAFYGSAIDRVRVGVIPFLDKNATTVAYTFQRIRNTIHLMI